MARVDPRRAKVHRSYTVAEAADLFGVHRNTVRNWARKGLPTFKVRGVVLILGSELRTYAAALRSSRRVRCQAGTMYCLKCRAARHPPAGLVDALPISPGALNLRGICPACGSLMHRRASVDRLAEIGFADLSPHAPANTPSR